jgi:hypothetical protein
LDIRPTCSKTIAETGDIDPIEITARRIKAGESVGDAWLYGRNAVALLSLGGVSIDQLQSYRRALHFSEQSFYGEATVQALERDRMRLHEAAEQTGRQP